MTVIDFSQVAPKERVFIIGDLLIDRTYYVDVPKLSPEAPVPVAMLTGDPIDTPGGAGLAAALATLDNIPTIFGTYTSRLEAFKMSNRYRLPILYTGPSKNGANAVKTRYIDNERHYHLLRVDSDRIIPPPFSHKGEEEEWFRLIERTLADGTIKVLMLLDYRKGLLDEARSQRLIIMAHNASIPVYVDSRCDNLSKFKGAEILKLNNQELQAAKNKYQPSTTRDLCKYFNIQYIIETLGKEGANITHESFTHFDVSYKPDLLKYEGSPDVTGCGDVFDVTFCYHWGINKVSPDKAVKVAVDRATKFAYEPIRKRLKWQS